MRARSPRSPLVKRLVALVALVGVLAGVLLLVPSDHYLFLPDRARPVDPLVTVPGEGRGAGRGGIYMVDILVRKANLLERIFPGIEHGASLVPEEVLNPQGLSESQRRRESLGEMSASQKIAVAVALRSLGREVPAQTEVVRVEAGSPAEEKLRKGDVILEAKGRRIESPVDLFAAMRHQKPGDRVRLTIRRDGKERKLVVGTKRAEGENRAVMGILVDLEIRPPLDVHVDAGDVGGPSAGLAFALDIVDELGRDVDGGRRVAVTGALDLDGSVVAIGGIKQKTLGAREAGAKVFVVPDENARDARRYADGVKIVPVASFAEAVSKLRAEAR
ncbi:MAG: PDZ domain-containing protein [Actinomycetota bacterium]|nr:PDZ domain-containing protein [Actinomycetota bacterium]